jgi:hypothetical protein
MARPPIEGVIKRRARIVEGRVAYELSEKQRERGLRHIAEIRQQLERYGRREDADDGAD